MELFLFLNEIRNKNIPEKPVFGKRHYKFSYSH